MTHGVHNTDESYRLWGPGRTTAAGELVKSLLVGAELDH